MEDERKYRKNGVSTFLKDPKFIITIVAFVFALGGTWSLALYRVGAVEEKIKIVKDEACENTEANRKDIVQIKQDIASLETKVEMGFENVNRRQDEQRQAQEKLYEVQMQIMAAVAKIGG